MIKGLELDLAKSLEVQGESQKEIQTNLLELEKELDRWIEEMCSTHVTLRDKIKAHHQVSQQAGQPLMPPLARTTPAAVPPTIPGSPPPVSAPSSAMPGEDYKATIEKLLQGSIESLGDKLSDKIMAMLKELKTLGGPMREYKIAELQHAAQSEHVDLAGLFLHEKVESNLGSEGLKVEEKKGTGIGSILDKLKKMKGPGDAGKTG